MPKQLTSHVEVKYLPQLGYLLVVPLQWTSSAPAHAVVKHDRAAFEDLGWEFRFSGDTHVYYKDVKCNDLDVAFGDVAVCCRELAS